MTIDDAIRDIEIVQTQFEIINQPRSLALDTAVSTMRKYQKIEQILKDIPYGGDATLRRIQEVVEDGRN